MPRIKIFYGYWILVSAFLIVALWAGCSLYAFGLFIKPIQAELGWSRTLVMNGLALWFVVSGLFSPLAGRTIDKRGAKRVLLPGAFLNAAGFLILSRMTSLWGFYLGYGLIGAGSAAVGYVTSSTLVSNWFVNRRGLAIGIVSTGIGIGGMAFSTLFGGYLIPTFGWRTSYLILAALPVAIIVPLTLFVIKTKPSPGDLPDVPTETGTKPKEKAKSVQYGTPVPLKAVLWTAPFILIAFSYCVSQIGQSGVFGGEVAFLIELGYPVMMASLFHGIVGLSSSAGKLCFGMLCDYIPAKYAWTIGMVCQIIGAWLMMNLNPNGAPYMLYVAAIILGVGFGAWLPTMSMSVASQFGLASYGAIFGAVSLAFSVGSAGGFFMSGFLYDLLGNYQGVFYGSFTAFILAIAAILLVRGKKTAA